MRLLSNRAIVAAVSLAILLGVASCGGGQPVPTAEPATPTPIPPTVAPRPATPTTRPTALATALPTALPVLRVGVDAANPPWCRVEAQGTLAGIDVDLLSALGREMGVRFEAVNLAPHLLAPELAAKRVDLIAAGLISTTERASAMALSRPYVTLEQSIVLRGFDAFTGTAALSGRSVGVQIGGPAVDDARKAGGKVKIYDDLAIALAALARGEVQAVLGERPFAADFVRRHPELGLRLAASVGSGQPVALGVAKENAALLSRVNAALDSLSRRGDLAGLERRWLQ